VNSIQDKEETKGIADRNKKEERRLNRLTPRTACDISCELGGPKRRIAAKEITIRDCEPAASYKS